VLPKGSEGKVVVIAKKIHRILYGIFVSSYLLPTAFVLSIPAFSGSELIAKDKMIKPVTLDESSPKEVLRSKIFQGTKSVRLCQQMSREKDKPWVPDDSALSALIEKISSALKSEDAKSLVPLFHKRLKISENAVKTEFRALVSIVGAPFDVSVFRLWALNSPDGSAKAISCAKDELSVYPLYGYPLQFAIWLQVQGQSELARIFIALVPDESGKWVIGAYKTNQWTHHGKDYSAWIDEARKKIKADAKFGMYVDLDIASKLLLPQGFLDFDFLKTVRGAREEVLTTEYFERQIKETLQEQTKDLPVVYISTLLVPSGSGILLRMKTTKELPAGELRKRCESLAKTLFVKPWAESLSGLRCSLVFPSEKPDQEGVLGGLLISRTEISENK